MISYETQAEIASTFGVSRQAVGKWLNSDTFPDRQKNGWPRDAVTAWVAAKNERELARAETSGDKDEKLRLECDRLRISIQREGEKLKQEKVETRRVSGLLHDVAECEAVWSRVGATLRGCIDSWQQHQTAKFPDHRELIGGLCASFLESLEAVG